MPLIYQSVYINRRRVFKCIYYVNEGREIEAKMKIEDNQMTIRRNRN